MDLLQREPGRGSHSDTFATVAAIAIAIAIAGVPAASAADQPTVPRAERAPRRSDATWSEIVAGPFHSSRLFAMPVADVVGAFQLSLSYEGTLLRQQGALTSATIVTLGFGDIAQLEYRTLSVLSASGVDASLPSLGVQLELPLPKHTGWPSIAAALRFGIERSDQIGDLAVDEKVSDLYAVVSWPLWGRLSSVRLHGGARVSLATIDLRSNDSDNEREETLILPTIGVDIAVAPRTRVVTEAGLVPAFSVDLTQPDGSSAVGSALMGRAGVRWHLHPLFSFDASFGYQIQASAVGSTDMRGVDAIVEYDIRLGGELFVPWGAISCRVTGAFCE